MWIFARIRGKVWPKGHIMSKQDCGKCSKERGLFPQSAISWNELCKISSVIYFHSIDTKDMDYREFNKHCYQHHTWAWMKMIRIAAHPGGWWGEHPLCKMQTISYLRYWRHFTISEVDGGLLITKLVVSKLEKFKIILDILYLVMICA